MRSIVYRREKRAACSGVSSVYVWGLETLLRPELLRVKRRGGYTHNIKHWYNQARTRGDRREAAPARNFPQLDLPLHSRYRVRYRGVPSLSYDTVGVRVGATSPSRLHCTLTYMGDGRPVGVCVSYPAPPSELRPRVVLVTEPPLLFLLIFRPPSLHRTSASGATGRRWVISGHQQIENSVSPSTSTFGVLPPSHRDIKSCTAVRIFCVYEHLRWQKAETSYVD